ncbi:MAG: hypothetical protein COB85_09180 [Bacteroidetes bacterium]|nr:MAG: hypothetical protein COB85_09180 [Bacteroidota bacterium]
MKTLTTILTLLILIGCSNHKSETSSTENRTELIPEPEQDTQEALDEPQVDQNTNKNEKCNCKGIVDWEQDVKVPVYNKPNGQLIDTVSHDIEGEDFLTFNLFDSEEDYFKVEIRRAISGQAKSGWIKKDDYLGTYASNYSDSDTLFLYSNPDKSSAPTDTITKYYTELYQILDCKSNWVKVRMEKGNKEYQGWMEPGMQCPSPYTTCN